MSVLWDDREATAGEKFADSDIIGIPLRIIVSERARESGGVEMTDREEDATEIVEESNVRAKLRS